MDRGDRRNPRRSQKPKDRSAYLARIHAYFTKTVYIPTTWEDAMAYPDTKLWQAAWESELKSIMNRGTFSKPVTVPESHNAITANIVWDVKYAEDGSIARYKARLVARGFTQVHGVDYEETFAPTIRYNALRIFLAIAAKNNLRAHLEVRRFHSYLATIMPRYSSLKEYLIHQKSSTSTLAFTKSLTRSKTDQLNCSGSLVRRC